MHSPRRLALLLVLVGLAGCSSEPTFGDNLIQRGRGTEQIGEKWNEGSEMVQKGYKLQEKGRDQVQQGNSNIKTGQDMVVRGRQLMAESEREFRGRK